MANFCSKCGKPIGQCTCNSQPNFQQSTNYYDPGNNFPNFNNTSFCSKCGNPKSQCKCGQTSSIINKDAAGSFFENLKNRMGVGDAELNKGDAFDDGKKIVPDCVKPNEGEVPVKQYEIAKLRSRIGPFTYSRAKGRIQVTNKRVIFRAPGKSIAGRTMLQHEFAIDELSGIEARREYVFYLWDLLMSLILFSLGAAATVAALWRVCTNCLYSWGDSASDFFVLFGCAFVFGVGSLALFFFVKKLWSLKIFVFGIGMSSLCLATFAGFENEGFTAFLAVFTALAALVCLVCLFFATLFYVMKPNLVIQIKTKAAISAIDIKRKQKPIITIFSFLFPSNQSNDYDDHTGYFEIIPADNVEASINELWAVINDIQKLGDIGINKWKVQ